MIHYSNHYHDGGKNKQKKKQTFSTAWCVLPRISDPESRLVIAKLAVVWMWSSALSAPQRQLATGPYSRSRSKILSSPTQTAAKLVFLFMFGNDETRA